jgi:hypothetical protein
MEKPSKATQDGIRILVVSIACLGGYFFSQVVIFGRPFNSQTLIVGVICSFSVALGLHFFQRKKEKKKEEELSKEREKKFEEEAEKSNKDNIIDC